MTSPITGARRIQGTRYGNRGIKPQQERPGSCIGRADIDFGNHEGELLNLNDINWRPNTVSKNIHVTLKSLLAGINAVSHRYQHLQLSVVFLKKFQQLGLKEVDVKVLAVGFVPPDTQKHGVFMQVLLGNEKYVVPWRLLQPLKAPK